MDVNPGVESSSPPEGQGEQGGEGGAFNPVTGEINWDCPCLGGMAHGPCGPQFREAFSCFVFSEDEPKGINCVDKFRNMQDCFRAHPDVYADEIMDDDEEGEPAPSSPGTEEDTSAPLRDVKESQDVGEGQSESTGSKPNKKPKPKSSLESPSAPAAAQP